MKFDFPPDYLSRFSSAVSRLIRANRGFIIFLLLMFVFRSSFADWNTVPTGSMKPTIVEGDRILVNKMAYDLRMPFTHISLLETGEPRRGDIVVFDSAVSERRLVKRIIAVAGDTVAIVGNRVIVNGESLAYTSGSSGSSGISTWQEDNGGTRYSIQFDHRLDNRNKAFMDSIAVPPDHYFVMGDNRNNSNDSRFIGLVPRSEIVGRTRSVVMSLDYDHYYLPRSERFFHTL